MAVYEKIRGTIESIFQLNKVSGAQIKDNSGVLEIRDSSDGGFAICRVATPVGNDDAATKNYVDTTVTGPDAVQAIQFNVALVTASSTATIPDDAWVYEVRIDVTTLYDNGATVTIGDSASATRYTVAGDSDLSATNTFIVNQRTQQDSGGALAVQATVANAPTAGAMTITVFYVTTPAA